MTALWPIRLKLLAIILSARLSSLGFIRLLLRSRLIYEEDPQRIAYRMTERLPFGPNRLTDQFLRPTRRWPIGSFYFRPTREHGSCKASRDSEVAAYTVDGSCTFNLLLWPLDSRESRLASKVGHSESLEHLKGAVPGILANRSVLARKSCKNGCLCIVKSRFRELRQTTPLYNLYESL
jgi:hypothetical protein